MFHVGPYLRLSFALLAAWSVLPAVAQIVKLRNETIQTPPRGGQPQTTAPLADAGAQSVSGLFLIQFEGPVEAAWTAPLPALGVQLLRYVPDHTFVARFDSVRLAQVRTLESVRWVGPYRPEHKLHSHVAQQAKEHPGDALSVSVLLSPAAGGLGVGEARRSFRAVHSEARSRFGVILRGHIPPGQLQVLANSSDVLWIEPGPNIRLYDEVSSKIVAGDGGPGQTLAQEFGYDGHGVTVAVADTGLDTGEVDDMHPDLAGRVTGLFYYGNLTGASDEHGHGTHVAGIIGGNGATGETDEAGALYGLGVASGVNLVAQRIFDADGNYEAPPSNETLTRDAVRAGAEIGSNSWGDDTQGRYDLSAMEFDGLVRDADELAAGDQPYILEFSAGNAGPGGQTIGSPAVAKNVIASGASQNDRVDLVLYEDGPDAMADFSSRGPCEDGRIKPDVVAPGTWIASLRSRYANDEFAWAPISDHYMYEGGTSQSGPHVSGAAAVFVQYYREVNTNRTPSPALVKAALINSAVDMDNSVETDPVPNLDEGWGRVDLTGLLFATRPGQFLDQAVLLQTGQTYERRVIIASAEEPLKITLAYTDVPGFPAAIPALVNDLDLEVIAPDGTVFHGNQFEDGESIPNAPGFDAINNVEGVHLSAPLPGEYVVRVRARNVVQDARRDTGAVDQDFAMVISGDIPLPGLGFVFLDRRAYTSPSTIRVKVIDSDLAGLRTVSVMLKSGTQPAGLELALLAADTTGSFTGALATATSPQGGRLQIVHGDTITAEYYDDSLGTMRSATARADLLPPNISAVGTTAQFGHTVVLWQTDEPAYGQVYFGTNRVLNRTASHATLLRDHAVRLEDLTPGVAYQFFVVSEDEAGNRATNNNGGSYFTFVPVGAATLLLVDAFNNDDFAFGPDIPLSTYTDALDQVGIGYEVWDATALTGSDPTLSDLKPYRVVIWRVSDNVFLGDTLSPAVQTALQQYVDGGGSFFMASMEQLSRLTATFKQNVLQVAAFTEDDTAPSAVGFVGNPVSGGMNIGLDYSYYQTDNYELFQVPDDVSDTMTVTTNAMPILHDGFGGIVGLASPRTGLDRPGRVVFLSFPLDAVPESDAAPNNRATLMRNILTFLAPGDQGVGTIALGSPAYTLPSLVTMEVADSDLAGQGQISASISSTTEPAGRTVTLAETARRGVFRGQITLVAVHGANPAAELLAKGGDQVIAAYLDASAGRTITATSIVEVIPPAISGVTSEPSYVDATIHWTTDEPADALVQFGESPLLGRTAYLSTLETSHEVFLDGLRPDRLYYYQISSRDQAGNVQVADHGGAFYTFRTLLPLSPPWSDDLEHGSDNWTVINADESEGGWTYGQPENELANTGHSGRFAWGSNLNGEPIGYVESFLISPPIDLTGGNTATLRFWQNYDFSELEFDILHYGEVMLITNAAVAPVTLGVVSDLSGDWEQAEFDLSPHLGKLVYVVWHYVLFSFDNAPRGGWLVDDVSVTTSQITPGTIRITNNIWQARWSLTGPANRSGQGTSALLTNLAPGDYTVEFNDVPYYSTPSMLSGTLAQGGSLVFAGNYGFADVNNNGMADAWEQQNFGVVSPSRTRFTDTDGDGMTDAAEFAAGTVPTQSSSNLRLALPVPLNGGAVRLEWPAVPGRAYLLEGSSDGKTWVPVSPWMQAGSTLGFFSPPTGPGAPYLFRLQVKP